MADRARYKLGVWEVQLRDIAGTAALISIDDSLNAAESLDKEVWVRRKQRIG